MIIPQAVVQDIPAVLAQSIFELKSQTNHDIACPLCREKYGNTNGKLQEKEGMILAREFLKGSGLPEQMTERIVFLVGHHHTLQEVDGIDDQILLDNLLETGFHFD